jgi:hypothetical protein
MGYKLLGVVVWKGAKWFLRRKYGATMIPVPVLAAGVVLAGAGVALAVRRNADAE